MSEHATPAARRGMDATTRSRRYDEPAQAGATAARPVAGLRAERGLSRQDLADAVAVNDQTVGYLERG